MFTQNQFVKMGQIFGLAGLLMSAACAGSLEDAQESEFAPYDDEAEDIEGLEQAILGGTTTRARPEVGMLSTSGGTCTATLFSSTGRARHILTAAHCIRGIGFERNATFTIDLAAGGTRSYPVKWIFSLETPNNWPGEKDLAVGVLQGGDVASSVAKPAFLAVNPWNGPFTMMGYGCTNRSSLTGAFVKRYRTYPSSTSNFTCPGDSGGPVFKGNLSDNGELYRVNSGYKPDKNHDLGAHVDKYYSHISTLAQKIDSTAGQVCYRAHVAGLGWRPPVCDGGTIGTTGQDRAIEAVQVWNGGFSTKSFCYTVHVKGKGWLPERCDGEVAGTVGEGRRMEAIRIRVRSGGGSVSYRAHVQGKGWLSTVSNNAIAGTTGEDRRLEALTITAN